MSWAARIAGIPFRLANRAAVQPPHKALILKPCCLSQVMLTTPLLAALSQSYPQAQFDWAVGEWSRAAVATNPRLRKLIPTGQVGLPEGSWTDVWELVARLREERYDTCFIPTRSAVLAFVAWRAGIPQRIGLNMGGRGFAHTIPVSPPSQLTHETELYLALAQPFAIQSRPGMEFAPRDTDRARATEILVEKADWLGDRPLVILHPGGGQNPVRPDVRKRWPPERFALLGNYLCRQHQAAIILVGDDADRPQVRQVAGLMTEQTTDLSGLLSLGELSTICEIADLYVGNDCGTTHLAAAVGCRTVAIFGPTNPDVCRPFVPAHQLKVLACPRQAPFSWENGATVAEAIKLADALLRPI